MLYNVRSGLPHGSTPPFLVDTEIHFGYVPEDHHQRQLAWDALEAARMAMHNWLRDPCAGRPSLPDEMLPAETGRPQGYRVGRVERPLSESEVIETTVTLLWTPCRYGGRRPWFRCPGITRPCGRRVGVLYATETYFLCRHCCGRVYQSQHEGVAGRAALRARRTRARLGDYGALLDPLPKRTPGMRRKTYLAICAEIEAATELALGALAAKI